MVGRPLSHPRLSAGSGPSVGFTLIELMVVITVVSVLTMVAVPSFTQMIANNRVRSAASTLQAALLKGRSEALKRNCPVLVRPRQGSNWATGMQVVATSASCAGVPAPEVVLQEDALSALLVEAVPGSATSVTYLQSGRVDGAGPAFYLRDLRAVAKRRCVLVELSGLTRVVEAGAHTRCPQP